MGDENAEVKARTEQIVSAVKVTIKPEIEDIAKLLATAEGFEITTSKQMEASASILHRIKERSKYITELRMSITRPMDDAKRRVMAAFAPAIDRLGQAEAKIKGAVLTWTPSHDRPRATSRSPAFRRSRSRGSRRDHE